MGATRVDLRLAAAMGELEVNPVMFEACQSVNYGGVLFLLPFLLAQGLFTYQDYYPRREGGYYSFDMAILTVSFMYLCRIKTIEQLKHHSSGEFGKLLGLDRVPEARCLRGMFRELNDCEQASSWNAGLAQGWIADETPGIYYIDGHVQVYHGHLAQLGKKHVSRQRLCLPGMMEFWVNNADGLPYFFVTGQVNEKLQEVLVDEIIPRLGKLPLACKPPHELEADPLLARYTLVFDREAYSPKLFGELWESHRVAVITYRKNVKDHWEETEFDEMEIETQMGTTRMYLHEKEIEIDGVKMREVRKLNPDGHQTSVLTTNRKLPLILIALYMFARWAQENFFRYMRQEYDLDRITQYGVDVLDTSIKVVNREYSNLTAKIKKTREKIARRKATLFSLEEENIRSALSQTSENMKKQLEIREEITSLEKEEQELMGQRNRQPYKICIGQMPEQTRYNKLKTEAKHLQNIIKMICYRAETALANILAPHYAKNRNEIRTLVKSIIFAKADIIPDLQNKTLTVILYSLATNRDNEAVMQICGLLNETETIFPGTDLRLIYKTATI